MMGRNSGRSLSLGILALATTSACAFLSPLRLPPAPLETTATAATSSSRPQRQQHLRMASSSDEPRAKQRAVIVGGGPAGALLAVYLSRSRGFEVDVFEAFEESKISGPTVRSWNVVLFKRGSHALESAGVDLKEEAGESVVTLTGSVRHHAAEKEKPTFTGSTSICRGSLAKSLLNKASRMPDVNVHYGCSFSKVDMGRRAATFERASGDTVEREYDMLVGADGVNSRVRKALEENVPDFSVRQREDDMEFKTISIPVMGMEGADESWKTRFHVANSKIGCIIGPSAPDGVVTATIVLPSQGKNTFDALMKTPQDVRDFFGTHYPCAFGSEGPSEEAAKDFLERRPQRLRSTYCSSLTHGNVVLIGDAAHSMYASLGQGVNSALEDSEVFGQVLESATAGKAPDQAVDVPKLLAAYNDRRLEDALAAVALSEGGMGGARTVRLPYMAKLFVTMLLHKTLGRLAPKVFAPPSLMAIGGNDVSYGAILRGEKREATVARGLLFSTVAFAAIAVRVLRRTPVI